MGAPFNQNSFDSKTEAQILFGQARDLIENTDSPKGGLGWMDKKNCENALPLLKIALSLDPDNADIRCGLGDALKTVGKNDEALFHLKKTLTIRPDMFIARLSVLNLLIKLGNYREALPLAKEGTRQNPKESMLWYAHAHCCMTTRKFDEALQSAKMALDTATIEDLTPSSRYKNNIVTMIHQARQALKSQPTAIKTDPQPG